MNCNILRLDENYVLKALLKVRFGVIAQLVERCDGIAEVSGSRPLDSIRVGFIGFMSAGTIGFGDAIGFGFGMLASRVNAIDPYGFFGLRSGSTI